MTILLTWPAANMSLEDASDDIVAAVGDRRRWALDTFEVRTEDERRTAFRILVASLCRESDGS